MVEYLRSSLPTPQEMPMDQKVSAMLVEPSVIDAASDAAPGLLPSAVIQTATNASKPWNEIHPIFRRTGNRPTNMKSSHDKLETSDQEEARLLQQGVDGISNPLYLGKNVDGSRMDLPPMLPTEKLLKVDLTNHKSMRTLMEKMAKLIAQKPLTGKRDICGVKCWTTKDGQVRPLLENEPERSEVFCDNMTMWACDIFLPMQFFRCFDLSDHDTVGCDAAQRFRVNGCGQEILEMETVTRSPEEDCTSLVKRKKENSLYKAMLCSVPLTVIATIHKVLDFAKTLSLDELNNEEKIEAVAVHFKAKYWKDFHPKYFFPAVQYAAQIKWNDTDLSTDFRGTLNTPEVEAVISAIGSSCVEHQCGINMIRQAPVITNFMGTEMTSQIKFYNKIFETISSSQARSQDVGQKLHYLLNPSTSSQKVTLRSFYEEGVSRAESTHSCAKECEHVPDLDDMLHVHQLLLYPLAVDWSRTLVKCSIHDHIELVEGAVDCTSATYFPHIGCLKKKALKKGEIGSRKANQHPEGLCIHYFNGDTRKFIGNYIHSRLGRYGSTMTEGWQQLCLNLAWGSLCGQSPVLAICVAGPGMCLRNGEICKEQGFDVKRALYFRMICADVIVDPDPNTALGSISGSYETRTMLLASATGLYSGKGSLRFNETDHNLIGVDIGRLTNLRITVMDKNFEPTFCNMGRQKINLRPLTRTIPEASLPVSDQSASEVQRPGSEFAAGTSTCSRAAALEPILEEGTSSCSSDIPRLVAGAERRNYPVSMLTREKVLVTKYYVQTSAGRVKKGQKKERKTVSLLAGGDRYQVPDYASNGLLDKIRENAENGVIRSLYVWRDDEDKFRWEFEINSSDPMYVDNTQTKKASSIPSEVWHEILEFGEKPHARGGKQMFVRIQKQGQEDSNKFYLPVTIKELLLDHVKKHNIGFKELNGWRLIRTAEGLVKTVPKSKNDEPPIILLSGSGIEIRNHLSLSDAQPGSKRSLDVPTEQGCGKRSRTELPGMAT
jgi:hypothetical protein